MLQSLTQYATVRASSSECIQLIMESPFSLVFAIRLQNDKRILSSKGVLCWEMTKVEIGVLGILEAISKRPSPGTFKRESVVREENRS